MIRACVEFCIENDHLISHLKDFTKFSHDLKEPLTAIKGFAQILLQSYSKELDSNVISKIKKIYSNTEFLETQINTVLNIANPESSQNKYDVLIIEDDAATIDVLTEYFDLRGYKCKGVNSGKKGFQELTSMIPKLILLDILLPDIDGYEVCKKIREQEQLKKVPIYYITAVPEMEVSNKLKETGADGYLLKPFNLEKFEMLFNYL